MNEQFEQELVQALDAYPQAELPPAFVARVMARVERETAVQPAPFQLQFLDWAIPAFVSLLLVTIIVLAGQTDWLTLLLEMGETAVFPQTIPHLGVVALAVVGELALVALICLQLWGEPLD